MVSRRRLLLGTAAAVGTVGFGLAGVDAWASPVRARRDFLGGGLRLPDGGICPVDYRSREAWGCDESIRDWEPDYYDVQTLVVHHTATASNPSDPAAVVRSIYQNQTVGQDFGDIGYNLLIDQFGVVYEGRYSGTDPVPIFDSSGAGLMVTGAHVLGFNSANLGVCLIGDFTAAQPTAAARQALVTVLAGLARVCGIDPLAQVIYVNPVSQATNTVLGISGHRDWAATECPGDAFYPFLQGVRTDVAALLGPPSGPAPEQPDNADRPRPTQPPSPPEPDRTRSTTVPRP